MSKQKNQPYIRLGIIVGVILVALLVARLMGPEAYENTTYFLKAVGLVLLGITLLVTIHELGHFLTAKWFGMRVETFSIGFPPKLFSLKRGETDYQIGATPLGGYVKISGIIDESMDTEHIDAEPQPWEFRAKPVWQRLIVMTGGVIMNVLLGILIFALMTFAFGERFTPIEQLEEGISVRKSVTETNRCGDEVEKTTLGYFLGFRSGDKLLSYNGNPLNYFEEYSSPALLIEENAFFEVERDGEKVRIDVPDGVLNAFNNDTIEVYLFSPINLPSKILISKDDSAYQAQFNGQSPAELAGIQSGDVITQINGQPVRYYQDLLEIIPTLANQQAEIRFERADSIHTVSVQLDSTAKLGILPHPDVTPAFSSEVKKYGFFESFPKGWEKAFSVISLNIKGFQQIFRGNASAKNSVMGPLAIGKVYKTRYDDYGWAGFWELTASLSMILAFVNILPIPALDGGHVLFLLIEAITRKEPSTKVRIIAQQIGMFLLLGLMVLVIFNDTFTHLLGGGC